MSQPEIAEKDWAHELYCPYLDSAATSDLKTINACRCNLGVTG